jgi:hypothetical protein
VCVPAHRLRQQLSLPRSASAGRPHRLQGVGENAAREPGGTSGRIGRTGYAVTDERPSPHDHR